jgi:hypothetical protein
MKPPVLVTRATISVKSVARRGGQRPQRRRLDAHRGLPAAVPAGDELVDEPSPFGDIGEVAGAAQDQRLVERSLEVAVVGLHCPVLVRLAGIATARGHSVVGAELFVAAGHVLLRLGVEVAIGRGEAVGAMLARDAAEGPERVLEVLGQRGEALAAEHEGGVLPATVGHHEVEHPVRERRTVYGDAELGRVGEVRERHAARLGRLAEDHVARRPVQRAPVAHPPLQRPADAVVGEGVGVGNLKMPQRGHRLGRARGSAAAPSPTPRRADREQCARARTCAGTAGGDRRRCGVRCAR